jgi:hypothetical protein
VPSLNSFRSSLSLILLIYTLFREKSNLLGVFFRGPLCRPSSDLNRRLWVQIRVSQGILCQGLKPFYEVLDLSGDIIAF